MKKWLALSLIGVFLCGLAGGILGSLWLFKNHPTLVCGNSCQGQISPDRKFFADEIIISGQTGLNQDFLLRLDLNRKKVGNEFQHYYYADISYGTIHRQLYTSFLSNNSRPQPADFLKTFSAQMAEDLSARESLSFDFVYGPLSVRADISGLEGDFLVKNTLEYTKYISEGDARVFIGGREYVMHSALAKIYSPDYSRYVFFDGYEELKSLAQFYALWDAEGNFYVLDTSEVYSSAPNYKSHTWVLYKDRKTGLMKKAFAANTEVLVPEGIPNSFKINLPDLNARLEFKPAEFFTTQKDSGQATGSVTLQNGSMSISGYFLYHTYGR